MMVPGPTSGKVRDFISTAYFRVLATVTSCMVPLKGTEEPSRPTVRASTSSTFIHFAVGMAMSAYFFPASVSTLILVDSVKVPRLSSIARLRKRMIAEAPGALGSSLRASSSAGTGSQAPCWATVIPEAEKTIKARAAQTRRPGRFRDGSFANICFASSVKLYCRENRRYPTSISQDYFAVSTSATFAVTVFALSQRGQTGDCDFRGRAILHQHPQERGGSGKGGIECGSTS